MASQLLASIGACTIVVSAFIWLRRSTASRILGTLPGPRSPSWVYGTSALIVWSASKRNLSVFVRQYVTATLRGQLRRLRVPLAAAIWRCVSGERLFWCEFFWPEPRQLIFIAMPHRKIALSFQTPRRYEILSTARHLVILPLAGRLGM
jgi:hypothetical protein